MRLVKLILLLSITLVSTHLKADGKADLAERFRKESKKEGISSAVLVIYRYGESTPVFNESIGSLKADEPIAIASASKWITSATVMTAIDQKKLNLGDTTGKILGPSWKAPQSQVTLRQLLSFTSGLEQRESCILRPRKSIEDCSNEIAKAKMLAVPGEAYNYGNTNMQVAGRMLEVATQSDFANYFHRNLSGPLGMNAEYYTFPKKKIGKQPLLAGGIVTSTNDYLKFLKMLSQDGVYEGKTVLSKEAILEMEKDHYRDGMKVMSSPLKVGNVSYHYALGNWVECKGSVADCKDASIRSSAGTFGFYPWIDRKNRYYAIYATEDEKQTGQKSFDVVAALKPLIEKIVLAK